MKFYRDTQGELRKVIWPTKEETMQTVFVVIGVVLIAALFYGHRSIVTLGYCSNNG